MGCLGNGDWDMRFFEKPEGGGIREVAWNANA